MKPALKLNAAGRIPSFQQTPVAAFLISAHGAQARRLAGSLPGPISGAWQVELHAQYCREMELLSLLTRATAWAPDPTLLLNAWRWELAWMPQPAEGAEDLAQGLLIDTAAFGHALHTAIRPATLIPEGCDKSDPFALAMLRLEFESARLLQAQIMILKDPALLNLRESVTASVESRHAQVRSLWREMLGGLGIADG